MSNIAHSELCLATAKRFNDKFALYEYKSYVSKEEPDVLVFGFGKTTLFEIKMSLADFNADKFKWGRKKYYDRSVSIFFQCSLLSRKTHTSGYCVEEYINNDPKLCRQFVKFKREHQDFFLKERLHLGNRRYYVCPEGIIPVEKLPEGWGLYYFKNGRFYLQKESGQFRTNLRTENSLAIHALRRYASGDKTGILVNTYGDLGRE